MRLLKRTFVADCNNARKVFLTGEAVPGQTPDKLYIIAEKSIDIVSSVYREHISCLDEELDFEKIEDLTDIVDTLADKFDDLKYLYSAGRSMSVTPETAIVDLESATDLGAAYRRKEAVHNARHIYQRRYLWQKIA